MTPPVCQEGSGFLVVVTISIGFGYSLGLARERVMMSEDLLGRGLAGHISGLVSEGGIEELKE